MSQCHIVLNGCSNCAHFWILKILAESSKNGHHCAFLRMSSRHNPPPSPQWYPSARVAILSVPSPPSPPPYTSAPPCPAQELVRPHQEPLLHGIMRHLRTPIGDHGRIALQLMAVMSGQGRQVLLRSERLSDPEAAEVQPWDTAQSPAAVLRLEAAVGNRSAVVCGMSDVWSAPATGRRTPRGIHVNRCQLCVK